ncbi:superoxide dismutase [candidate division WWE3 bacterium RIFCSPHIGHO2_12_FULL_38_15]|uniref:Superoxide dismutase n=1 Tax=candidate division WWE3 bacterium RIFCSPHIGHO2_02_FULL_38_14 TaxID=1802620 RepID=A0A1F4V879_UNCKA|nr:MAG: superoxide dismutase [candidate division WWE3 bacterium RIFCSPHIGHO2_01_FULL_38_45]OGC48483.1 MAG: superoxide dismutase [candidate division WWE3 bacterium RIFCSPHIGHO2_12_FULL_38_15]OGC53356.1 MAG: superoxide dismutase [candidate division WWE3 bacterium RIFCSPHIGHO2_02_FULL_38_14]OGC53832.1 MAG: superoxide dismutase [candidate division WWE3 bacterium RIFCSPLOWO2_01_FULL_37_24]HLB51870.1 superoxide dismutase [Patescibacteria group bacterium]
MSFELPQLQFAYDALEPYIDAMTMEIHHSKHHAAYINNLNKALEPYMDLETKELEELVKDLNSLPESIRTAVQNNGGGHYNHTFFWKILTPNSTKLPEGLLAEAINKEFGNFENFKMEFNKAAMGRFGSGWAWLIMDGNKNLSVVSTPNQDNPIMGGFRPVLGLDVWEHAYYLKYQNRRADYVNAFWNVVNWIQVQENFGKKED